MPYPDDFNSAALDAAMGRDEDAAAAPWTATTPRAASSTRWIAVG